MNRTGFISLLIGLLFSILTPPAPVSAESIPEGMILIKGGCFMMGTDKDYVYEHTMTYDTKREQPAHRACVDSFYLDTHEATQEQWFQWMNTRPSRLEGENLAVDHVKFREALLYCKKRGGRLPTEAEWEYAAKAGSDKENFWGDGINGDYAWYETNSARKPHPVGTKKPNPWGLYDMMGGVWEWVSDWYDPDYYKTSPVDNPKGPRMTSYHVIKGASWIDDKSFFRGAVRVRGWSDGTETFLMGVRCAKSAKGN